MSRELDLAEKGRPLMTGQILVGLGNFLLMRSGNNRGGGEPANEERMVRADSLVLFSGRVLSRVEA